jgi:hypothetical protein
VVLPAPVGDDGKKMQQTIERVAGGKTTKRKSRSSFNSSSFQKNEKEAKVMWIKIFGNFNEREI